MIACFRALPLAAAFLLGVWQAAATVGVEFQMLLGNPSGAESNPANHEHYLIQRPVEALDYSDRLGQPLWASCNLTAGDIGPASRSPTYFTDSSLPAGFHRVTTAEYNGVGAIEFNRGHLCPSEDRTATEADNDAVFLMSNIMPQSAAIQKRALVVATENRP